MKKNGKVRADTEKFSESTVKKGSLRWRKLFTALICAMLILVLAITVCTCLGAAYVESHPEIFKADLSLFLGEPSGGGAHLYYFPSGATDPICDISDAVELEQERLTGSEEFTFVPLSEIPENLRNAFVAIEDKRFYEHRGVDFRRTAAAILNFLLKHDGSFGGSTITQQLIKNATGESAKTPMRKITEIFRALDLEKHLGKDEILEQYLNIIHLANGCRGVGSASALYFGKAPSDLTLSECAVIAAITQNPSRYDPLRHPENNRTRRNNILREMFLQGYISESDYELAAAEPITVVQKETSDEKVADTPNSWYTDLVIEDVIDDLTKSYGYSRAEASHLLYYGGLHIYTFMNPEMQSVLSAFYADESNFPRLENGKAPQSGMILLNPETGNILAVAGAIGEKGGDRVYSFATDARRPPGSVLKPLSVYAPALESGLIGYATVYDDIPVSFGAIKNGTATTWPRNASGIYRGLTNIDYAISHSLNTVAVRVLEEFGIDRSFAFLKNTLHIDSLIDRGENGITDRGTAALALGQMNYGATLREITSAYTIFTNSGIYRNARSYALVLDSTGRVLLQNNAVITPAISEDSAVLMTKMLENVTDHGTARTLTLTDTVSVAGKTGTTQYSFDRWFVGYTPDLLAGVWYGCEYPESLSEIKGNPSLSVFDTVLREIYESCNFEKKSPHFSYESLREVRVCADSGLLFSDACALDPRQNRETVAYFTATTVPHSFCTCHTAVPYSGTGSDPMDGVVKSGEIGFETHKVGLIRVNRRFPVEIYVTDAQYAAAPTEPEVFSTDPFRPYFASSAEEGVFFGRSYTSRPFNRPCTRKPEDGTAQDGA